MVRPTILKMDGASSSDPQAIDLVTTAQSILYDYHHSKISLKYDYAQYVNEIFNFPFRFSFTMKNDSLIQPGKVIQLIFPHHNNDIAYIDQSLSGNYLVTEVIKRETRGIYNIIVTVVSNSQIQPITPLI